MDAGQSQLERSLASNELALGHAAMLRLLERLPMGVISFRADLVVEYANPAARHLLGADLRGSVLPDEFPRFSLPEFAGRFFTPSPPLRQVVETDDGRLLELEGVFGGNDGAVVLLHDVTSEEQHRRAEQEFVTNAAHELQTPIAAIAAAVDALERGAQEVPEDRERFLGHIERETDRLARLVAALLHLARIQIGQETPSLQSVQVAPVLDEVAAALEPGDGVDVRVDCDPSVGALADVDLLRQAILNLAVNAARHTRQGEIRLEGRDLGGVTEIEIRDTGSGMTAETRAHVGDRFYRGLHRSGDGFGLGLPISIAIADALGGTLAVESELGIGTRVLLQLPSVTPVP